MFNITTTITENIVHYTFPDDPSWPNRENFYKRKSFKQTVKTWWLWGIPIHRKVIAEKFMGILTLEPPPSRLTFTKIKLQF